MTDKTEAIQIPDRLPIVPIKDVVIFPYTVLPLSIGRERSVHAVDEALSGHRMIFFVSQKDAEKEEPSPEDIFDVGTVAVVVRMMKLLDGQMRILVQGVTRGKIETLTQTDPSFSAKIQILEDKKVEEETIVVEALIRAVKQNLEKVVSQGKTISPDIVALATDQNNPGRLADLVAANLDLKVSEAQTILETLEPIRRLQLVNAHLEREIQLLDVQQKITSEAREEIDKVQRDYFLRQQLKAIQKELGERGDLQEEIDEYREKISKLLLHEAARQEVEKQLSRLEKMSPESPEAHVVRTYLDWVVDLPWGKTSRDNLKLDRARVILDEDHYDLEKIKERMLEYLAVRKLRGPRMKGPLLCFVGPPGVGKTSLGRSIARALGRKFARISLGGVRDEAEIRGHRRTYVGALPGRIIQGIHQAGSANPVFMLDEIDKLGADFRGDPSAALLEVLDPEQNHAFRDHYLGVDFDLSQVMFIATANYLDPIHPAFLDRMEVIRLAGYTLEEKIQISRTHLIPKQIRENGIKPNRIEFTDEGLATMISRYTREAGLRNLERNIAAVCRKVAVGVASGAQKRKKVVTSSVAESLLGPPIFQEESLLKENQVGVATGLAWTPVGGDILFIESQAVKGKGAIQLTGHLGDVMKESALAALTYAKAHAKQFRIPDNYFTTHDIHVHVPAGAIPKDGPSAGVTMVTAMISLMTARPVRRDVAMTGEITLRGEVLPVGGIKEKILAAHRAGVKEIILPTLNKKDLEEIPEEIRKTVKLTFADSIAAVLKRALLPKK
ncbi:MAG TPA: endopeptidase La [Thermoanaerobaculia bacterium]|nr:endopeptidase La [Thermoanaerobaculia bacterium]HUM28680.1 endopeptidase La [Thermoanaerobaculia bacterium]HXK66712.1 endopeptidase La [Thermoanaerobaculia bacterium]